MALQPNSDPGHPFCGFITITFLQGWIVSPAPNPQPGGPGLRIYDPRIQNGPAIPHALGTPFSRLLQHAWVTVGLFFNPSHHTGYSELYVLLFLCFLIHNEYAFWDMAPCSYYVAADLRLRGMCSQHYQNDGPDDGCNTYLWNVVVLLRDYTAHIPEDVRRPDDGDSTSIWKVGTLTWDYTAQYPRRGVFTLVAIRTLTLLTRDVSCANYRLITLFYYKVLVPRTDRVRN
jgi:hypothetical protein